VVDRGVGDLALPLLLHAFVEHRLIHLQEVHVGVFAFLRGLVFVVVEFKLLELVDLGVLLNHLLTVPVQLRVAEEVEVIFEVLL